jgi:hypothetical protein
VIPTKLSPYHQELLRDIHDWKLFELGIGAFARISGMSEDEMLSHLTRVATPEQRDRVVARAARMDEYERLDPAIKDKFFKSISGIMQSNN